MRKPSILFNSTLLIALFVLLGLLFFASDKNNSKTSNPPESADRFSALASSATSTDKRIQLAESTIKAKPQQASGYNQLCSALIQKARETGDFSWNSRAEAALKRSLEVNPNIEKENYDALRLQATLHLTYHRFAEALQTGQQMQKLRSNDHYAYGVLTDAFVELGRYQEAVEAADKMSDLHPDSTSYARISYLRALHGYQDQAIEAMRLAVRASSPADREGHAWYRVQLGNEFLNAGKLKEAGREFETALQIFPDYYEGLATQARLFVRLGDVEQAIALYRRAQERVPSPDTVIALGDLYAKQGRTEEAQRQYALLEAIERSGSNTYSPKLALYLADHDLKLDEALNIAQRERAARSDIYTCDLLAWCLFKKGDFAAAKTAIDEALRLGTRDARIYYHAGMIAQALKDHQQAAKYLNLALATNPTFDVLQSEIAKQTLKTISNKTI